ncbi:helix-turn-helix transcriptional regulator [Caldisalinibacter kiritimatiensis]|uniref:Transcriptional regulator, AraC family n=1 Tax=Caldisalinibacter kiritimatiensis TaxID=1304284 RepID=R1CTX4_9FIRM|nr:AraC family transcriptional regulator [Caldisalinibacter kiritimatiensis]EOD00139.1 transcriptional regulator, AraC family [Caldisalinibacter kiritimatiensis]
MKLFELEEELINKMDIGDKKSILKVYKKLYECYTCYDLGNGLKVRSIKNHLILLNQHLYNNFYNKKVCKYYLYNIRNNFISKIEKTNEKSELYKLGEEMIINYSNILIKKCFNMKNPIVCKAINYIHNHIDENLSLDEVSTAIHVSKNYLSSLFVENTGYSFSNYINKLKIENSKSKLKDTSKSILDIAIECGFNSQSYFCSTFKKYTGITPNEYRKNTAKYEKNNYNI